MLSRRIFVLAAIAANAAPIALAFAAETKTFDSGSFAAAQNAGKPILVAIHASWCPTCKAQKPILSELMAEPKFKDLIYFVVDFDTQKDAVKYFGARMQSTLIAFKGTTETGRSVGDTERASIAALLNKTLVGTDGCRCTCPCIRRRRAFDLVTVRVTDCADRAWRSSLGASLGPAVLAAGLAVSFVAIGLFIATIGYSIGLDAEMFRNVAAALTIAIGIVLLVPRLQERLALAAAPLANWGDRQVGGRRPRRPSRPNGRGRAARRRSGVPASVRRLVQHHFLRRKDAISARSLPPCCFLGSGRLSRSPRLACCHARQSCACVRDCLPAAPGPRRGSRLYWSRSGFWCSPASTRVSRHLRSICRRNG